MNSWRWKISLRGPPAGINISKIILKISMGFNGNTFNYIKAFTTAEFASVGFQTRFTHNTGKYFLDRTWSGAGIDNTLASDASGTSAYRYTHFFDGTALRFYTNDTGTYLTLA